jgi:site-specific DNA-methyltransferase (adenine-specific)
VVLDQFLGSGSTGVVAAELGRRFVGIELDGCHFAVARQRILSAYGSKPIRIPSSATENEPPLVYANGSLT